MRVKRTIFFFLLWLAILYVTGIVVFTKGFLLKRLEVPIYSSCKDSLSDRGSTGDFNRGCWLQKRFDKAVILVIDALRFDFTVYNSTLTENQLLHFQNKLPIMHKLMEEKPLHTRLYKFLADPPTTTMQRLKGLTTGSLPTFVDAGSNFASSDIVEDNVISQLTNVGGSVTFMGDDTWESLFSGKFKKSYPYPSFNVKDLHTVDNGVIEHLLPEMKEDDWHLLIGHFLGVDHCGHRFGPYHSAMAEKLTQMDQVIRSVLEHMSNDTLLLVMGDHGMTVTGDHGGDSEDELAAALFLYSPSQLIHSSVAERTKEQYETVSQVDLVPTLSLLLGTAIPYSNLGSVMTDLFTIDPSQHTQPSKLMSLYKTIEALQINALQVKRYVDAYSRLSDEFPYVESLSLQKKLEEAESLLQQVDIENSNLDITHQYLEDIQRLYIEYLSGVKTMCQSIWAKFDLVSITLGICVFILAIVVTIIQVYQITVAVPFNDAKQNLDKSVKIIAVSSGIGILLASVIASISVSFRSHWISTSMCFVSVLSGVSYILNVMYTNKSPWKLGNVMKDISVEPLSPLIITAIYVVSMLSNSYVVNEDSMSVFLFQSLLFVILMCNIRYAISKKKHKTWDIGLFLTQPASIVVMLTLAIAIACRLSANFRVCREHQLPRCETSIFYQPLSTLPQEESLTRNCRYFFSVACVIVFPICLRIWLSRLGNLNGSPPAKIFVIYLLPIAAVCLSFHWALQALPQKILDSLAVWQQVTLPRAVYVIFLMGIGLIVWEPLTLFVTHRNEQNRDNAHSTSQSVYRDEESQVVKRVFNQVKSSWKKSSNEEHANTNERGGQVPMVYGLATAYSASYLILIAMVTLVLTLLLGDGFAPAILLLLIQMFLCLELYSCIQRLKLHNISGTQRITHTDILCDFPWYIIVLWGLMASQYFFATGHQATVPAIRFESGYVGFHGDFPTYLYFLPAIMIGSNTFAGPIIFTLSLPLVLLWPFSRGYIVLDKKTKQQNQNAEDRKGEFSLHENEGQLQVAMLRLILMYLAFSAVKVLGTMVSAAIHRRHLMVWAIFAPRFVFEGVQFLVVILFLFIDNLLILRLDSLLSKWFKSLVKKYRP
ncbi:GPI ethanolamine phosphate transferase 3, catalytic subunit-like [Glandiceps talaboti]